MKNQVNEPDYTTQFKKDYNDALKQGRDISELIEVMNELLDGVPLSPKRRDHALKGKLRKSRECHIEFDWVLVYRPYDKIILFERTGTHSKLFD